MTTQTQTCRDCTENLPLDAEHWRRVKDNRTGYSVRCKPCDLTRARARRQAREDAMTEEQWEAYRTRKRENQRAWEARNPDKVAGYHERYKLMEAIPKHLDELRDLRRLQMIRDDFDGWKVRAQARNAALRAELGGDGDYRAATRAVMNDARYISISTTEDELMRLMCKGRSYLDRRLEELKVAFESYSEEDIRSALQRAENKAPGDREPTLSPACQRWLARTLREWARREAALTPEQRAARAAEWAELWAELFAMSEDDWRLLEHEERKAEMRARDLMSR